jgi:hypothetical protein
MEVKYNWNEITKEYREIFYSIYSNSKLQALFL